MVPIDHILAFLEDTFRVSTYPDVSYNGLQCEGRRNIRHIATGVDAATPFLKAAVGMKADLAIVHHGLFWKGEEWRKLDRFNMEKVDIMLKGKLNLYGLHLPLDSHPEYGNNVRLAAQLGALPQETFYPFLGEPTGLIADLERPLSPKEMTLLLEKAIGPVLHHLDFGPARIRRIGIVSGGGWRSIQDPVVLRRHVDAVITGEVIHQAVASARELSVHVFAVGHYATETFGVKSLGEALAKKFDLKHTFLDFPTGL
jgi:dinuclear metal center YbgI/SA1388 family protein